MATSTWFFLFFVPFFLIDVTCEAPPLELYNSSDVGVTILTSATFNATIFSSETENGEKMSENFVFFVQFYNTWCGHCQHFAPSWKSLANKTLAWQKTLRLAVVDCSKRENAPVCNQYGVSSYPTMKFFLPKSKIPGNSTNYVGPHTEPGVYLGMLDYLDKIKFPEEIVALPPKSLGDLWREDFSKNFQNLILILESPDSKLGRDVILSVLGRLFDTELIVRRTTTLNKVLLDSIGEHVDREGTKLWFLKRDGQNTRIDVAGKENSPTAYIKAIFSVDDELMVGKGFPKPIREAVPYLKGALPNGDAVSGTTKKSHKIHAKVVETSSSNMTDLVGAVIYMFSMEISTHKIIELEEFVAFRKFIFAITNLIPFPAQIHIPLRKLSEMLREKSSTTPVEVANLLKENGFDAENSPTVWVACRGSVPGRRGYPCALWQLFHTLTVLAVDKKNVIENSEKNFEKNSVSDFSENALDPKTGILSAIFGYIQNFFSCQECRENFMQEATNLLSQTTFLSNRDAVLWLWRTHNGVNRRLTGDVTEDEGHPKIQFPSIQQCSNCRLRGSGGVVKWRDDQVVDFLKNFYGVRQVAPLNVRDSKHRQIAALDEDPVNSASQTEASSTLKLYLAALIFVGGVVAGFRHFQRWRKRPVKWEFGFNKARVKWM